MCRKSLRRRNVFRVSNGRYLQANSFGTRSMSVGQCDLGSGSAVGDKGKRILGFTSLMTTPCIPKEEEEMPRVDVVYENIQNIPPLLKTYIKTPTKLKRKHGDESRAVRRRGSILMIHQQLRML
ncbi:hypothetical protein SUGI_0309640 [Cryptomeria japonica]|nr:hypothetical protein SUGI_0309640 [Cryptomeria japonica]